MQNNSLVSVIMNCYNCEKYLKEAIDSVLNQTYRNWEIIFWDNQSTDNSAQIVKSYDDKRIKYFYAQEFTPLGRARNLAIEKTNGKWVAFLDCDDIWDKNKLAHSFNELINYKNNNKVSLIYSKALVINKNNKIIYKHSKSPSGYIHDKLLSDGDFIVFSSIIVKKDILNQIGKINENLNYCEDYELLLKVTKNYEAIGVDEYLISYRMHSDNITSTKVYENNIEVVNFLKTYIFDTSLSIKTKYYVWLQISYRINSLSIKLLLNNDFINFIALLRKNYIYLIGLPLNVIQFIVKRI